MIEEREALLRGIFLDRENALPRLVFADYLEERDEQPWAELLRMSCEHAALPRDAEETRKASWRRLTEHCQRYGFPISQADFGFLPCAQIELTASELLDFEAFRKLAAFQHPEWFGAKALKVTTGPLTARECLITLLTAPALQLVTELSLTGQVVDVPQVEGEVLFYDMQRHPLITSKMVEELVSMRECRRLTVLDLRFNGLGNDALRAIARSTHLHRLKSLGLTDGNEFKGRVWQEVQERFGEEIPY
ncbi:MAG: TIGR02996 domain-containing protein [Fimbriiglobus sp.]